MRPSIAIIAFGLLGGAVSAAAAPAANEIMFNTPYLSSVPPGTTLSYAFERDTEAAGGSPGYTETLGMKVMAGETEGRRTASVDRYRGARHTVAGPFTNMTGNPILLMFLEQDVAEMSRTLKGSPFYIRNRLREALAQAEVLPAEVTFEGQPTEAWKIAFTPFAGDEHKAELREFAAKRYEFIFAEAVPGGIYSLATVTPKSDGGSDPLVMETLTLSDAEPAPVR